VIQNNNSGRVDNDEDSKSKRSSSLNFKDSLETLEELKLANCGSHYLIVYPDIATLRKIYSRYIKTALDERNELVIFLP
jgi:hypothetical protein